MCTEELMTCPLWGPKRGTMPCPGEAGTGVTWKQHLGRALVDGRDGETSVPGSGQSPDKGWRCRNAQPLDWLQDRLSRAQFASPHRCCLSPTAAATPSGELSGAPPNGTTTATASPIATSNAVRASRGILGRRGEDHLLPWTPTSAPRACVWSQNSWAWV